MPRQAWAEEWGEGAVVARPMCVLGAGGGWGAKQWPADRFGELGKTLKTKGFDVVVNAARKDDEVALRVVAASGGAVRMVVCNVAGLIALMRRAELEGIRGLRIWRRRWLCRWWGFMGRLVRSEMGPGGRGLSGF